MPFPDGRGAPDQARLAVLTNTPAPYRIAFFNFLADAMRHRGGELHVIYCALRESHRAWPLALEEQRYDWLILKGAHPRIGYWRPHINPGVIPALRQLRPRWLLSAGAWNTPTMMLAASPALAGDMTRIFWAEGHADAVIHAHGPVARLRRRVVRWYDGFAVPSEPSAAFIRREVGEGPPIISLRNTVDEDVFTPARTGERESARASLEVPTGALLFVCVAQLEERKGVEELLEGFLRLRESGIGDAQLVFVGDGPKRRFLEERAAAAGESVRFAGHQKPGSTRQWLVASDAFVLSSRQDPNPLSAVEAASVGRPLLLSRRLGNAGDLVVSDTTGRLIHDVAPDAIFEALHWFARCSPEDRQRMGDAAARIASDKFRGAHVAEHFVTAMLELWPARERARS